MALAGFGAGGLGGMAAKRFLAPAAGKAIGRILPGLAGKTIRGKTLGQRGTGIAGFGGFMGGWGTFDAVTEAALHDSGEPPRDDTIDDVLANLRAPMPFGTDQQQGLQQTFDEASIRDALELLGVDFAEFSELAGRRLV